MRSTQALLVTNVAQKFPAAMAVGQRYLLVATADCWFAYGTTSTATTNAVQNQDGAVLLPAGVPFALIAHDDVDSFIGIVKNDPGPAVISATLILTEGG